MAAHAGGRARPRLTYARKRYVWRETPQPAHPGTQGAARRGRFRLAGARRPGLPRCGPRRRRAGSSSPAPATSRWRARRTAPSPQSKGSHAAAGLLPAAAHARRDGGRHGLCVGRHGRRPLRGELRRRGRPEGDALRGWRGRASRPASMHGPAPACRDATNSRAVPAPELYSALRSVGLEYGPAFQPLVATYGSQDAGVAFASCASARASRGRRCTRPTSTARCSFDAPRALQTRVSCGCPSWLARRRCWRRRGASSPPPSARSLIGWACALDDGQGRARHGEARRASRAACSRRWRRRRLPGTCTCTSRSGRRSTRPPRARSLLAGADARRHFRGASGGGSHGLGRPSAPSSVSSRCRWRAAASRLRCSPGIEAAFDLVRQQLHGQPVPTWLLTSGAQASSHGSSAQPVPRWRDGPRALGAARGAAARSRAWT